MPIRSMSDELLVEVKGGIAVLTLNRPKNLNALTPQLFSTLAHVCREASEDESVKVLVITGAGKGFCAGADVTGGHRGINDYIGDKPFRDALQELPYEGVVGPVAFEMIPIWECIKPIIAAVNGVAVGGGLAIAAAADIRIASEKARFGMGYQGIAIVPDAANTYLIPRLIGYDKALEMYLTDAIIDANEASRLGLVTKVVPHDQLMEVTMKLAEKIARGPGLAQVLTKRGMREGLHNTFRTQLDYESYAVSLTRNTEDFKNAILAFREKKTPKFRGR